MSNLFRHIPAVDRLLADPAVLEAAAGISKTELTRLIRTFFGRRARQNQRGRTSLRPRRDTDRISRSYTGL